MVTWFISFNANMTLYVTAIRPTKGMFLQEIGRKPNDNPHRQKGNVQNPIQMAT